MCLTRIKQKSHGERFVFLMNRTILTDGVFVLISIRKLEAYFSPEKPFYI